MRDAELVDGMELLVAPTSVCVGTGELDELESRMRSGAVVPADPILRALHGELSSALCWLDGVSVQLSFYEAAPLFLGEPRQRAKLVDYVAASARRFRELGSDELNVSWRDEPALIAADHLRLRRTPGAAGLTVERVSSALSAARR